MIYSLSNQIHRMLKMIECIHGSENLNVHCCDKLYHNFSKSSLINESAHLPRVRFRRTVPVRAVRDTSRQRVRRCVHIWLLNTEKFSQNHHLFVGSLDAAIGSNSSSKLKKINHTNLRSMQKWNWCDCYKKFIVLQTKHCFWNEKEVD